MNLTKALNIAGVPAELHIEVQNSVYLAKEQIKGVLWHKFKARMFKAKKIAKQLKWESNRLIEENSDMAMLDIAPMLNITCNGDFIEWELQDVGGVMRGRPNPDCWLNPDPESEEYKHACEINRKYFDGAHPRSFEARVMWYRRNAGEFLVYSRGMHIKPELGFEIWRGKEGRNTVTAWRSNNHWIVNISEHKFANLYFRSRMGFEIDNIFCGKLSPQMWFPVSGYTLRAPVSYSTVPKTKGEELTHYKWETPKGNGAGKTYSRVSV